MKILIYIIQVILCVFCFTNCSLIESRLSDEQVYGQKPPGIIPEIYEPKYSFIEDLIPEAVDFSPDFGEVLYTINDTSTHWRFIYYSKKNNEKWDKPEIAYFVPGNGLGYNPKFSPDGTIITYGFEGDIWKATRNGDKWTTAEKMPEPINTEGYECSIAFTESGSIYLAGNGRIKGNHCDIYCLKNTEPGIDSIRHLDNLSTPATECMLTVAPNENYIVFTRGFHINGHNATDLFISFRNKDESWTLAQKLGPYFNSKGSTHSPRFSNDGKYLFFNQVSWNDSLKKYENNEQYWVSTKYFDNMRDSLFNANNI